MLGLCSTSCEEILNSQVNQRKKFFPDLQEMGNQFYARYMRVHILRCNILHNTVVVSCRKEVKSAVNGNIYEWHISDHMESLFLCRAPLGFDGFYGWCTVRKDMLTCTSSSPVTSLLVRSVFPLSFRVKVPFSVFPSRTHVPFKAKKKTNTVWTLSGKKGSDQQYILWQGCVKRRQGYCADFCVTHLFTWYAYVPKFLNKTQAVVELY